MIFTRDFVTRENHWQITPLVTKKSLFTITHALFFILCESPGFDWAAIQTIFRSQLKCDLSLTHSCSQHACVSNPQKIPSKYNGSQCQEHVPSFSLITSILIVSTPNRTPYSDSDFCPVLGGQVSTVAGELSARLDSLCERPGPTELRSKQQISQPVAISSVASIQLFAACLFFNSKENTLKNAVFVW